MNASPREALVAVTYRCNSRCVMCNIWQGPVTEELPPSFYGCLPASLKNISLTGGEPLLRDDLPEIVEVVSRRCGGPRVVINTNGFLPDRAERAVRGIMGVSRKVGLRVSIDGEGETHDTVRGVPGAYARAMETLRRVAGLGLKDLGIAFTVAGGNLSEAGRVYELSRRLGVEFTMSVAHSSEVYFRADNSNLKYDAAELRKQFGHIVGRELKAMHPKRWYRAYYEKGLYRHAMGLGRTLDCGAMREFFFMDPAGVVFPCNILNAPAGRAGDAGFDALWLSEGAGSARERVSGCRKNCWMVCTAAPAMRKDPLRPLGWIGQKKLCAHLGLEVL